MSLPVFSGGRRDCSGCAPRAALLRPRARGRAPHAELLLDEELLDELLDELSDELSSPCFLLLFVGLLFALLLFRFLASAAFFASAAFVAFSCCSVL